MSGRKHDSGHDDSLFARGIRFGMRPARALAGSVAPAAEPAVDELLAGPLPEIIGRSIGEHRVIERIVSEAAETDDFARSIIAALESERTAEVIRDVLASPAVDRLFADVMESGLRPELTDRLLQSPEFDRALRSVLSSPEIRRALARQSTSLATEAAAGARRQMVPLDGRFHQWVRRVLRRPPTAPATEAAYGGFFTRGLAFAVDIVLVAVTAAFGAVIVHAVGNIFDATLRPQWLADALVGIGWLAVGFVYFVGFWSTAGQTPGMRLLGLRVVSWTNSPVGFGRAAVRFFGLQLAIIPCFAGFLPALVDNRGRALQDFIARTFVVYDERAEE